MRDLPVLIASKASKTGGAEFEARAVAGQDLAMLRVVRQIVPLLRILPKIVQLVGIARARVRRRTSGRAGNLPLRETVHSPNTRVLSGEKRYRLKNPAPLGITCPRKQQYSAAL